MKIKREVKIENLGKNINTEYAEFAPVVSADETRMIFTSRRPGNLGEYDEKTGGHYEDIYMVEKDENGQWGKPKNIGDHINTPTHDASIGISPDGNELYIYRANPTAMRLSGDIYYSSYEDEKQRWSEPIKMQEGINSKYWEPHASVTANGQFMFFTSDREDGTGKGGSDQHRGSF